MSKRQSSTTTTTTATTTVSSSTSSQDDKKSLIDSISKLSLQDLTNQELKELAIDHARLAYSRQISLYTRKQLERAKRKTNDKYVAMSGFTPRRHAHSASVQPAH